MEIVRVDFIEYEKVFPVPYHIFNSVGFSELNKDKCLDLHYLEFVDKKIRFGLILGEKEQELRSPFSAPFGGFSFVRNERIEYVEQAVSLLKQYGEAIGKEILISLPPSIYEPSFISKCVSAFLRKDASIKYVDLNFQFETDRFAQYDTIIDRSARKNLHNSLKHDFQFIQLDSKRDEDVSRAYQVIKSNRESKGFPLRMPLQSVLDTVKIIPADFFVLSYNSVDVAAAQVFHVAPKTAQVIYWGDVVEYSDLRVMNYFTYKVFEYYYNHDVKILDIGPSTEFGIPNYGLCEFKENIGCSISLKYTFEL